jgi:hypothetical protein
MPVPPPNNSWIRFQNPPPTLTLPMVQFALLRRSFIAEPGDEHISDLRITPLSESPWASESDSRRLRHIVPSRPGAHDGLSHASSHTRTISQEQGTIADLREASQPSLSGTPTQHAPGPERFYSESHPGHLRGNDAPADADSLPLLWHSYPPSGPSKHETQGHTHATEHVFPVPQHYMDAVEIRQELDAKADQEKAGPPSWLGIVCGNWNPYAWCTSCSITPTRSSSTSHGR